MSPRHSKANDQNILYLYLPWWCSRNERTLRQVRWLKMQQQQSSINLKNATKWPTNHQQSITMKLTDIVTRIRCQSVFTNVWFHPYLHVLHCPFILNHSSINAWYKNQPQNRIQAHVDTIPQETPWGNVIILTSRFSPLRATSSSSRSLVTTREIHHS